MTEVKNFIVTAWLLTCIMLHLGCSEGSRTASTPPSGLELIQIELRKSRRTDDPDTQINHLCRAYEHAEALERDETDPAVLQEVRMAVGPQIDTIPRTVYKWSMLNFDLDAFKWSLGRLPESDITYNQLLDIWQRGKYYRDYCISLYPERSLSIFMKEAMKNPSTRFFDQHLPGFKEIGYKVTYPLQQAAFNAQFCHYYAEQIDSALRKNDIDRIKFLLEYMPSHERMGCRDEDTEKTMGDLSDFVIFELNDEALACRLIELGYPMNRIDLEDVLLGEEFMRQLDAHPEYAVMEVLKLNEWYGPLSKREWEFIRKLPPDQLQKIHRLHLMEAIGAAAKYKDPEWSMRLVKVREEVSPLEIHEYERLLEWALIYEDEALYAYVKPKCRQVNVYRLDLSELADNWPLFRRLAPKIMRKIYPTMDTTPKMNGTTLGRIDVLLRNPNPDAALYVVTRYDLESDWEKTNKDGRTLLMAVCEGGNLEAAKYLIEKKKADIHAYTDYDKGELTTFGRSYATEGRLTPLFFAVKSGNVELVEYLAEEGADVNASTCFGGTPLMYAAAFNQLNIAKTLVELGADKYAAINDNANMRTACPDYALSPIRAGETAYSIARDRGNREMMTLLRTSAAVPN